MSKHIKEQVEVGNARIVDSSVFDATTPRHQVDEDRNFELPTALYGLTVALYFAFLVVAFAGFAAPGLVIPVAISALLVFAGFGVPTLWTRLAPKNPSKPMTMGYFKNKGIMTNTGWLSSSEATIQMLILPVLIALWGLAVVTIAALI
ncbi:MAG: hypothetical protein ABJP48_03150 [Erythrobacter sp.]